MATVADRFVSGLDLSRRLYGFVQPLLAKHYPGLPHSAALLGDGSEVLGFDTERSTDHDWGPRLQIFLHPNDVLRHVGDIGTLLSQRLPKSLLGYPTNFVTPGDGRTRHLAVTDEPVSHGIEITDLGSWFRRTLGFDPRTSISALEWLATPTQSLAATTGGAVFHDGLGELEAARTTLTWYPTDVWRYVLARQWQRIAERESFVGRCGEVGDELGSSLVAAQLVRELVRLRLLQERVWAPYDKWLGTTFAQLTDMAALGLFS